MSDETVVTIGANHHEGKPGDTWLTYTTPAGGGVQLTSSVASLAEAVERCERLGYRLALPPETHAEMVQAGVAPADIPEDLFTD
jgi:hypothetical protein